MTHLSPKRNMVPKAVLMRSRLVSLTTARPVNTTQPRITVNSARPMTNVFNKAHSTVRRPINNKTATKNSNFNQRVNTVKDINVNAARSKVVVNTAKPKAILNAVKENQAIVKVKTINGEQQLSALVDGKKIIITEATIKRDLQLEDADGVDCLPNATIFEQLTLMGYEKLSPYIL
ncbi:hypothetical protein Tco_0005835 [Tanacetum coccineum]